MLEFPYPGASPDGLIQCDSHGKGVLQIKYPHNYRYELKKLAASQKHPDWRKLSSKNWPQILLSN